MPTGYMLNWSDNTLKPPFLLPDATVDNHTTSLQLTGKRVVNWGEFLNENMLHLLEHGFSKTAPKNPTIGQLWLDANSGDLKIFTSQSTWNVIVNVPGIGTQITSTTSSSTSTSTSSSTSTSTSTSTTPSINLPPDMTNFVHTIPTTMVEGTSANVSFSGAVDPEGGTVTYELILPAYVYASKTTNISSGEIITLTVDQNATGNADVGSFGITIRAVDPQNLYSSKTVVLNVTSAIVVPTVIGTPWQGGYYYGRIKSGSDIYGLVMSPKAGQATNVTWSEAMAFCDNLTINNFSDWVCPSKDELEIAYRYLKPLTGGSNATKSGANANSIPPSSNYTLTEPSQTNVIEFQYGNSEFIETGVGGQRLYWTSTTTELSEITAYFQSFSDGNQDTISKDSPIRVRAIRRVKIN
jgi:hypothetical protein